MSLPPRIHRSVTALGATAGLVGAFAAGTAIAGDDDPLHGRVDPVAFSGDSITLAASCDDLLDWYVARGVQRVGPWGWDTYYSEVEEDGGFNLPGFGGGDDAAEDANSGGDTGAGSAPQAAQEYAAPTSRSTASTSRTS